MHSPISLLIYTLLFLLEHSACLSHDRHKTRCHSTKRKKYEAWRVGCVKMNEQAPISCTFSLTSSASLMVCRTRPISPFEVAARCNEKRVSARSRSSPNISPMAMKNGEERNGCVSEYTNSQTPPGLSLGVAKRVSRGGVGLVYSSLPAVPHETNFQAPLTVH